MVLESKSPTAALQTFCFTFGLGSPLARYYVELSAPTELEARMLMCCLFSAHWAGVYPREGFDRQIREFGYQRLDVNLDAGIRIGTNRDEIDPAIYNAVYTTDWYQVLRDQRSAHR